MYQIQPSTDPYFRLIAQSIAREFPTNFHGHAIDVVEVLTAEILGTKQQRHGPRPSPESLVAIRNVIRNNVREERPIPFLVPWGSLKPNWTSIDLAELWALKMLQCLRGRVAAHYPPGVVFNLRVEDASAPNIFFDKQEQTRIASNIYSDDFEQLIKVLELHEMIVPVRETSIVTETFFTAEAEHILPFMLSYLSLPDEAGTAFTRLQELGWRGTIPPLMKQFYLELYVRLYPDDTDDQKLYRLARYLSGSLARKRLGMSGVPQRWDLGHIELSFMPIVPGTEQFFGRRVYYRTLPSAITRNHIPPWRAKGFVVITGEDEVRQRLASFNEPQEYNPNTVTLVNGDKEVTVQADYIVA